PVVVPRTGGRPLHVWIGRGISAGGPLHRRVPRICAAWPVLHIRRVRLTIVSALIGARALVVAAPVVFHSSVRARIVARAFGIGTVGVRVVGHRPRLVIRVQIVVVIEAVIVIVVYVHVDVRVPVVHRPVI